MISVHIWIQPTQERTTKPNFESVITFVLELGADEELKWSKKRQKSPVLQQSLRNNRKQQQHDFSPWMDPTNPREDHKAKFGVSHHLRLGAGGRRRLEAVPKKPNIARFAVIIAQQLTTAKT